jgi:hypothetical protein
MATYRLLAGMEEVGPSEDGIEQGRLANVGAAWPNSVTTQTNMFGNIPVTITLFISAQFSGAKGLVPREDHVTLEWTLETQRLPETEQTWSR